jgi:hypothetical protein
MGALAPDQTATLIVNGKLTQTQPLPETPGWLSFDVLADPQRPPLSDVRLRFGNTRPVDDLAKILSRAGPAGLLVRSAGQETGDFGHIYVNGEDLSPNARLQPVALTPTTGGDRGDVRHACRPPTRAEWRPG